MRSAALQCPKPEIYFFMMVPYTLPICVVWAPIETIYMVIMDLLEVPIIKLGYKYIAYILYILYT